MAVAVRKNILPMRFYWNIVTKSFRSIIIPRIAWKDKAAEGGEISLPCGNAFLVLCGAVFEVLDTLTWEKLSDTYWKARLLKWRKNFKKFSNRD